MELTNSQLFGLFIGQLAFGAVLIVTLALTIKHQSLELIKGPTGALMLKIITIFFICTITGNLALMKVFEPAAASALFGAVLGYVFGAAVQKDKGRGNLSTRGDPTAPHHGH